MRKIYVIGGDTDYASWMQGALVSKMEDCDLVVGTGGEDWHPSWYYKGHAPHPTLGTNYGRDLYEKREFDKAIKLNKKIIGICRSSQGLCGAVAGGEIVQHQSNDAFIHKIKTYDGREIKTSSTHHNAQFPFRRLKEGSEYKLLGWTENMLRYRYLDANNEANTNLPEAEDVYYPKINAIGINGHPEMLNPIEYKETIKYYQELLNKFMDDKL